MSVQQFAEHLAALDPAELTLLFEARPDVLIEPAPGNFLQLAQRLDAVGGVAAALWELTDSTSTLTRAVVALGSAATTHLIASLLETSEEHADAEIAALCRLGLAWRNAEGVVQLVPLLHHELSQQLGGSGPFAEVAQYLRVPELQHAARAHGLDPVGTKPVLVNRLQQVFADRGRLLRAVYQLPDDVKGTLNQLLAGDAMLQYGLAYGPASRDPESPLARLREAGLVFSADGRIVVPAEVAETFSMFTAELALADPPVIPDAGCAPDQVRSAATSSAEHALRAVTSLLDDATDTPITALKKGGIGTRERSRLARRLGLPAEQLPLWLDVASAAGLIAFSNGGYGPSGEYEKWRDATPARQWAALALSWLNLDFTPSRRAEESDVDTAPPYPIVTGGGAVRRRLLQAAGPHRSVAAVGRELPWFCAMTMARDQELATAIIREAELLGVVALDSLSELGRQLLDVRPVRVAPRQVNRRPDRLGYDEAAADELAAYCTGLLGETESRLILQSDLTAVVSGRPTPVVARMLRAAAVPEARGTAETWRFSSTSVREAMDAGWSADDLLASLREAATHELPQSLVQLIEDVARRHGEVRVREVRSCLVAAAPLATEICHTRALSKLSLTQPAPTVLVSPEPPEVVLPALRAAGFLPVAETSDGMIVVPAQQRPQPPAEKKPTSRQARRLTPQQLTEQLLNTSSVAPTSSTFGQLAECNRLLNDAELSLLANALDTGNDVVISYSDANASVTTRQIRPLLLFDRWVVAHCHLRNDERHFAVANIHAVSPVV